MSKPTIIEYRLPTWSLCALVNGDVSALSATEIEVIDEFEQLAIKQNGVGHWSKADESEQYFAHSNDIDSLGGDCEDWLYVVVQ